jgi:hypothetical protein
MLAELPDPNIVAYTTVMGGMNTRGEYAQTIELFEQEMLPKAVQSLHRLSVQSSMPTLALETCNVQLK